MSIESQNPEIYTVRNVAPNKWMMCVSFRLPAGLPPLTPEEIASRKRDQPTSTMEDDDEYVDNDQPADAELHAAKRRKICEDS